MNPTITSIHDAIKAALSNKFLRVNIDTYEPLKDLSELAPALLINFEELPKAVDVGDGRYPVNARISLHCVLGYEVKNLQIELQEFAISVSQFVYENGIWLNGSVVSKPTGITAFPGNFKKATSGGYDSWVVSWDQHLYLGESEWETPEVRGGIRLAVNPTNIDDPTEYKQLEIAHAPSD